MFAPQKEALGQRENLCCPTDGADAGRQATAALAKFGQRRGFEGQGDRKELGEVE